MGALMSGRGAIPAVALAITTGIFLFMFTSCDTKTRRRPPGYSKLGHVSMYKDVAVKEVFETAMLIRQDERGLYGMSTLCSHDLRRLKAKKDGDEPVLFCDVCESEFSGSGKVLKGPAVTPLPYFKLVIAEELAGGPKNFLYARISTEVSPTWRLPYPKDPYVEGSGK